ncbi:MAG TPA: sensor histidine kinase [Anaerolineales bacterium]
MLNHLVDRIRVPHFLDIATYVSMAAMSLLGMSGLPSLRSQLLALGLVIIFGLLYYFVFQPGRYIANPNLYFGAQALILGLLFLLGSNNSDAFNFLFLILCIHIAVVSPARVAMLWIAICFGIVSLITLATRGTEGIYAVVFYSITFVVCGFFGYTIQQVERARDRNQRLVEELQATQRKLQELAVVEERNRLARDLHDSVKQQVFAISMQLGAARALLDEGNQAYGPVTEAERLAKQAGAELTTLIRELRPPGLEGKMLATALQEYVTQWSRQNGIAADLKVDGVSSISLPGDETLFRVAQEALANVARHSKAGTVSVELAYEDNKIVLIVEDNGMGFDIGRVEKGVGLDSMRERLEAIGGQLEISSQRSSGTRIVARVRRP